MRIIALISAGMILSACTTGAPIPNFYNGHYYMSGDANCVSPHFPSKALISLS